MTHTPESTQTLEPCLSDEIIPDLNNIVRAIEDEGDRCYLGSTNDAERLREIANWLETKFRRTPPARQSDEALADSSLTAKAAWNAFADEYSQWKVLSIEEQIHWVEAFASARAEGKREGIEEAAQDEIFWYRLLRGAGRTNLEKVSAITAYFRALTEKQP